MIPVIIVIIIIILWLLYGNGNEYFDPIKHLGVKYIYPSQGDSESVQKPTKNNYPRDIFRKHYFKGQRWETRLPGLVDHRYSYDDQRNCCTLPAIEGKARLKDLPLHLRNWYHARIPSKIAKTDDYYWPDTIIGKKYKYECNRANDVYSSPRTIAPIITDPIAAKAKYNPTLDDTPFDIARRANMISGYNPSDSLPAQYADRSKTSIEKIIAAPNLVENRAEPIYGWLPYEY